MHHGGAKQRNETLTLAMESSILVNSIDMSWQYVCLMIKLLRDIDGESCWRWCCRVMLATMLLRCFDRDVM
jgi:hypothetical protein